MRRHGWWSITVVMLGVAMSGCASTTSERATGQPETSWVKEYPTIAALTTDATLVARATVEGTAVLVPADEAGVTASRSLLYTVRVSAAVKGTLPTGRITVRGMPDASIDGGSAEVAQLQANGDYLLFLAPFQWHPGVPTGEYVMVGQEGAYRLSEETATIVAAHDPLPGSLSLHSLLNQVAAAVRWQ